MRTQAIGDNTFVDSRVVSARPCRLVAVIGYNNGVDRFVHVHEADAVPANGSTPRFCCPADAQRPFSFALPVAVDLDGCTVVFSSTAQTTTITASADASIQGVLEA